MIPSGTFKFNGCVHRHITGIFAITLWNSLCTEVLPPSRLYTGLLWKRKQLIFGRTSRGGCQPLPPPPLPPHTHTFPSSLRFFWVFPDVNQIGGSATSFPALCLVDRKDLFSDVPLCNVNFPRFNSQVFLLNSCKKSFSLDLLVSFPSPSESLNCTWCTS